MTETLFGSLKVQRLHGMHFAIRRQAKDEVTDWHSFTITGGFNRRWDTVAMAFEKKRLAHKERLAALSLS